MRRAPGHDVGTAMAELAGDSALLVPPGQPDELAAAIETAIGPGDPARGHPEAPSRGLEVAARYTWEACAEGHLARLPAGSRCLRAGRGAPRQGRDRTARVAAVHNDGGED